MISELGFLSPEVGESEEQLAIAYTELFSLSEKLSKLLLQLLKGVELDYTSTRSMVINALAVKSLELFQASVILLTKGCIPAARVLCRAQVETVYKLCAITLEENAIDKYFCQEKSSRLQKLQCIHEYKKKYQKFKTAPGLEVEIDKLKQEGLKTTKPFEWARWAKMEDFHNIYYQGMSDDTHGNIESLNHYFDENSPHIMSFGPSDKGLTLVAAACHRTLINAIAKYASFLGIDVETDLALLSKENDVLENKFCA